MMFGGKSGGRYVTWNAYEWRVFRNYKGKATSGVAASDILDKVCFLTISTSLERIEQEELKREGIPA